MATDFEEPRAEETAIQSRSGKAPSLLEIFGLPLLGILVAELVRRWTSELNLLAVPFFITVFRLFILQFQIPPRGAQVSVQDYKNAANECLTWNQFALLPLMLTEVSAVVASSPTVPFFVWFLVMGMFAMYVQMRLLSRQQWLIAAADSL